VDRLTTDQGLEPFSNERHAIIQVKGEKEVLLYLKDFAETGLNLLRIKDQKEFYDEVSLTLKLSILVASCVMWSATLDSSGVLLSYFMISLA